ncbi:MAG TPA: dTDP-glucose 4,6-dehydratase [Candidatus Acidoferrum sp.]|nr:dTDP-glucose 4,6-dehydratase [Candidatus Acidoferrum sp.]
MKILVTGGAGFIGSNFVRHLLTTHPDDTVVNLDKLTYAGNRANLADLEDSPRYTFVHGDVCDAKLVRDVAQGVDAIVNMAAETHVDKSLLEPDAFLRTDVFGVFTLLETVRELKIPRLLHVSTDEVYGSVASGSSREEDPLRPSNPYSASKAGGDLLARAYWQTHGVPVVITRSSNNFGPYQYPEKVIPLFITNAIDGEPLPLYGDGRNVRDWLFVGDNCAAIDLVLRRGRDGEVYNIGGGTEVENIDLTREILRLTGRPDTLIRPVKDRAGHDRRYSLDSTKVHGLGWSPRHAFGDALAATVAWYRERETWWRPLKSGEFRAYYRRQYEGR